ncbi:MAG: hypothetical protein PHI11_14530 [Gallionella sp.]|nr:hypothetical protein [Gallionella sp.]
MSANCSEVFGYYDEADPKESGNPVPSSNAFALVPYGRYNPLRTNDKTVRTRQIRIAYDNEKNVNISYFINGLMVLNKFIPLKDSSCDQNGLHLTLRREYGTMHDKIPNYGTSVNVATLWRDDQYLYVKTTLKSAGLTMYVIPYWGTNEHWYRFPVRAPQVNGVRLDLLY